MTLQVHGGINLRLDSRSSPKHRRVPSSEALRRMAQQHNSAIANPAIFSPIPEDFLKATQQAPPLLPLSPALPEQLADVSRWDPWREFFHQSKTSPFVDDLLW